MAWVDAERPELIAGQYRSLVRNRSGVEVPEAEATAAALALLADADDWLMVLDNAAGPDEIYQYLPSGSGRVLVTTRIETWTANRDLEFRLDKLPRAAVAAWLAGAGVGCDPTRSTSWPAVSTGCRWRWSRPWGTWLAAPVRPPAPTWRN